MPDPTPDALTADTRAALSIASAELEALLAVSGPRDVENTLQPYHRLQLALANAGHRAGLFSEVHPARPMREAAETAVQDISALATELSLHRGLYDALSALQL
jgi:Zn-dependent oligopeptidase